MNQEMDAGVSPAVGDVHWVVHRPDRVWWESLVKPVKNALKPALNWIFTNEPKSICGC